MAVTSVSMGPGLRAWMDSGLAYILLEGTTAEFAAAAIPAPPLPVAGASRFSGGQAKPSATASPSSGRKGYERKADVAAPHAPAASVAGSGASASRGADAPAVREAHGSAAAPVTFAFAGDLSASPSQWPTPWRDWFMKCVPAPVLWTYHELGADVTGTGHSQERSAFLKRLIADLALPKGSSVFWPSSMPSAGGDLSPAPHAPLFAAGLRLLQPRVVVVFGDAALEDMDMRDRVRPFGQIMVEGKILVCLPDIGELLRGDAQRASVISLLRALFATCNFGT